MSSPTAAARPESDSMTSNEGERAAEVVHPQGELAHDDQQHLLQEGDGDHGHDLAAYDLAAAHAGSVQPAQQALPALPDRGARYAHDAEEHPVDQASGGGLGRSLWRMPHRRRRRRPCLEVTTGEASWASASERGLRRAGPRPRRRRWRLATCSAAVLATSLLLLN